MFYAWAVSLLNKHLIMIVLFAKIRFFINLLASQVNQSKLYFYKTIFDTVLKYISQATSNKSLISLSLRFIHQINTLQRVRLCAKITCAVYE